MAVTVGELKGYWKKVADAVSSNKMNVTDTDILAALMAIGQTIEDVEAEIQAIKSTEGIKKIADTVDVQLTGSNALKGAVQNVPTAGTRVQLPNYTCREVTIIAKKSNLGKIYIGGNDVSSSIFGAELDPGDSITLTVNNTNLIYIDASASGEGISYVAI